MRDVSAFELISHVRDIVVIMRWRSEGRFKEGREKGFAPKVLMRLCKIGLIQFGDERRLLIATEE